MTFGVDEYGAEPYAGYPFSGRPGVVFPLLQFEEAFTTRPLAESPAWVDLGMESLREFAVTHNGRSSQLDRPSNGSSSALVDVTDDRSLDATNTSSPYAPNVLPNRRVRLRIVVDGVTYPVFEHFANAHNMQYDLDRYDEALCALPSSDGFKLLNRAPLTGLAPRPKERAHVRVGAVLDWVGWPVSRRLISSARTVLSAENISDRSALEALLQIDDTECGRTRVDQAGNFVFLSRQDLNSAPRQTTPQATFSDSGAPGTIPYESIVVENSETWIRNIVRITHPSEPEIVVSDADSVDEYGPIEYSRQVRDVTAAARRATGEHFLAEFKDPKTRALGVSVLTSDTPSGFESGMFAQVAVLEVGDRVAVERLIPPGGGDPFVQECFIESKSDAAVQGELEWSTQFGFSYAPPVAATSKWDVGKWDAAKWGW